MTRSFRCNDHWAKNSYELHHKGQLLTPQVQHQTLEGEKKRYQVC